MADKSPEATNLATGVLRTVEQATRFPLITKARRVTLINTN